MDEPTADLQLPSGRVEFRFVPGTRGSVVVFHGGHMRAGLPVGERAFLDAGYGVLAVSRPGYGRTPLSSRSAFPALVVELCGVLGIDELVSAVGISAGGPAAVALAVHAPGRVRSLLLISARSSLPFPDGPARLVGPLAFARRSERMTWAAVRALMRRAPDLGLRAMMGSLSTAPANQVIDDLGVEDRAALVELFASMRSGAGFLVDVRAPVDPGLERSVTQPTLIVATSHDGAVGAKHASRLAANVPGALRWASPSLSHLVWFGSGGAPTDARTIEFLDAQ